MRETDPIGSRRSSDPARLIGLDVARAVAMLGMFIAHYGPNTGSLVEREQWPFQVLRFTDGRAMPLFVVLAGAGFAFLTRRPPYLTRVLWRAAVLLLAGLWLEGGLVLVILHFYAAYYVVGLLVRRLPPRTWLPLALAVTAAGAWLTLYVVRDLSEPYRIVGDSWWGALPHLGHPWQLAQHLLLRGEYPIFPSFAFFLTGMWLTRLDLRRLRTQATLVAAGVAMAVAGYGIGWHTDVHRTGIRPTTESAWWLLAANGHSQMPAWMVGTTGCSLAVISLCLWLGTHARRLVMPLAHAGQLALTFYVVHVALIHRGLRKWPYELSARQVMGSIAAIYAAFVVAAHLWRRRFAYGPAEAVLRAPDARFPRVRS